MSKSARSLFVFSIYLFILGAVLVVIPSLLLNLFNLPGTGEIWVRVVGMLVFILGFYYFLAAKNELKLFFVATVYGRAAVLVFFIFFVLFDLAQPIIILFGTVDALAALWTHLSLRSEKIAL